MRGGRGRTRERERGRGACQKRFGSDSTLEVWWRGTPPGARPAYASRRPAHPTSCVRQRRVYAAAHRALIGCLWPGGEGRNQKRTGTTSGRRAVHGAAALHPRPACASRARRMSSFNRAAARSGRSGAPPQCASRVGGEGNVASCPSHCVSRDPRAAAPLCADPNRPSRPT